MSSTLPIRPEEKGKKVYTIMATDIRFHRRKANNPSTLPRQIAKSVRNGKPGQAYTKDLSFRVKEDGAMTLSAFFPFSDEDRRRMDEYRRQGKKIVFILPKHLPVTIEK